AFKIIGGKKLNGEIIPQGAKNEALQIICATLLTSEPVRVNNLPNIRDIRFLISLLEDLGVKTEKHSLNSITFQADNVDLDKLHSEEYQHKARQIRGSLTTLGPLLGRFNHAYIPRPGGDKIGRRRIDTHLLGFQKLGASFEFDKENNLFKIDATSLKGAHIHMDEASVTGTGNLIMASVLAKGETTIYNAACAPYLQQLCEMLNSMGANIKGVGSNFLTINGVDELGECTHTCLPDMIEIGSFLGMAALTQSSIIIKDTKPEKLGLIPDVFGRLGIKFDINTGGDIIIPEQDIYEITKFIDGSILTIADAPWPGFTPDLLSIVLVVATQAKGSVLIHQKMFESRLFFTDKLIDMGAQIILCDPHRAVVIGLAREAKLRGIKMSSPDIRAGIALLMAALSAEGESLISNIEQIDRGYQNIEQRLQAIGANIERV
ncbi:UNVERIFIED_CONTAM: hypothetical protein GTU68_039907, partial [Idotea baltica]|nr:hypothetical protein [Idotea baltica]